MLSRADDLARMTVIDGHGASVEVGSLWRDKTAVLVFIRHFGCIHCRDHVVRLGHELAAIRGAGAELHVIGNGSPSFIEGFREQTRWAGPVYTDPSLAVYKVAQLKRSVARTLDPRSLGAAFRAFTNGSKQGLPQGDQWQQGGTLVITPQGDVRWHHASDRPGDNATAAQIVAALG
jgi:hypothetical protein